MSEQETPTSVVPMDSVQEMEVAQRQGAAEILFDAERFAAVEKISTLMSQGKISVGKELQGNQPDCFAIALLAVEVGMNPFMVAQKTHVINGKLGMEAQLVNALIIRSGEIRGNPRYEYLGDWTKVEGKIGWKPADEDGLACKVSATWSATGEEREWTCYMNSCKTRNSPNWATKPRLQLSYQALKEWARVHCPGVTLGVYSQDELAPSPSEIDMGNVNTDQSRGAQLSEMLGKDDKQESPIDVAAEVMEEPPAKTDSSAKEAEKKPEPKPKKISKTELMKGVAKLNAEHGIPDHMVNGYLVAKGHIPESATFMDAPEDIKVVLTKAPKKAAQNIKEWFADNDQ